MRRRMKLAARSVWIRTGRQLYRRAVVSRKTKIFCIGRNKTGTTSLQREFQRLGYIVGEQGWAEMIAHRHYFDGDFEQLIRYCKYAQVFQDAPFSWPGTFRHLDAAYPGSKFVLSVRDDPEQWHSSFVRFHHKIFAVDGRLSVDELRSATYRTKGFAYNSVRLHGTTDEDPYNAERMKQVYLDHNRAVREHFADRPHDMVEINVARPGDYGRLMRFIGEPVVQEDFPWANKT